MDSYMASIMTFAFNWTPMYFAQCNGATLQITQNQALFALLGAQFGGNGTTNFMLPDLQGRTPVHFGTASGGSTNRVFAAKFGQDNETLTTTQLPVHTHAVSEKVAGQTVTATAAATAHASNVLATLPGPTNHYWAPPATGTTGTFGYSTPANISMASDAVTVTVTPSFNSGNLNVANTGSGAAFSLAQPSLALNFCICTAGIFPSRT